jgi:hypothetical protein
MKHRRIACATISVAISFGVLGITGSAFAAPYGGHAMRKYGPDPAQIARGIQEAQYAEQVRALDSGTATLATPVTENALTKQSEQWAEQVRLLDDGTASLPPVTVPQVPVAAAPAGRVPGVETFGYWLTIGILSGMLALALSTTAMFARRRTGPQLSV